MRFLQGEEAERARGYLAKAAEVAKKGRCLKSQRGVVIVKGEEIIGEGYNAPPGRYICEVCLREIKKPLRFGDFNTEPCSALHAEQRAIIDALRKGYLDLSGTIMYHIKVKEGQIRKTEGPSCTICSKLILEVGIGKFVNYEKKGIIEYLAEEFNELSFKSIL